LQELPGDLVSAVKPDTPYPDGRDNPPRGSQDQHRVFFKSYFTGSVPETFLLGSIGQRPPDQRDAVDGLLCRLRS
jgi:hypothetical protein